MTGGGRRHKKSKSRRRKYNEEWRTRSVLTLWDLPFEENQELVEGGATPCVGSSKGGVKTDRVDSFSRLPSLGVQSPCERQKPSEVTWMKTLEDQNRFPHSKTFQQKHPRIHSAMRAILLDWMIEVCEAFALHRQTFYLAQDYFDRFMLTQNDMEKSTLQLAGVTCLLLASKKEEHSPPTVSQLVYVTGGIYLADQIRRMELVILKALDWALSPETTVSWLKLFLQLSALAPDTDLLEQQFPDDVFIEVSRLLDLCVLHLNSLDFPSPVVAAAALSYFMNRERLLKVSGVCRIALQPCVIWMAPFAATLREFGRAVPKCFVTRRKEDQHNVQTHSDYLTMLEHATKKMLSLPIAPSSTHGTTTESEAL